MQENTNNKSNNKKNNSNKNGRYRNPKIKVVILGGVGEIGKNMTAIEYNNKIVIVDCGSMFPNDKIYGVDLIIPDFKYLEENKEKIAAVLLTHGHEDHIGATPFFLSRFNVPVYGTPLTLALVEHKLNERKVKSTKLHRVKDGDCVKLTDDISVECLSVCHSISGALAFAIKTPIGTLFFTGDYKIDHNPVKCEKTDLLRIAEIGQRGVLAMFGESTNVEREGYTMCERDVGHTINRLFDEHKENRIILATFATNVPRIQQILDIAVAHGRKVIFTGRSMIKIAELASSLGELSYPEGTIEDISHIDNIQAQNTLILSTGSQGEPMSSLARMASDDFPRIRITPNDTIIISASPIPGNEVSVYSVINDLCRKGANVIYSSIKEVHTSGHACREELKLMLSLLKPKFFFPVHGEYRHQKLHAELGEEMGVEKENIFIPELGNAFYITKRGVKKEPNNLPCGNTYVDGLAIGVEDIIIKDRTVLANDGVLIAFAVVSVIDGSVISGPDIIARGLEIKDDLLVTLKDKITTLFASQPHMDKDDRQTFKKKVRNAMWSILRDKMKTAPMIVPIILEA